jgi:aspartate/methionine/tyrosine aminotransferase
MSTTVTPDLAASLERLGTETAFSVLAQARALERDGRSIIHLEIGEPDFDTPLHICEAAGEAMRGGQTHYCPAAGIPELREAAADYLSRSRGISVKPENILVGTGAKPFLFFTILATCNPGDEVVYPDPGFPIYESVIRWLGATPVPLPHYAANFLDWWRDRLRPEIERNFEYLDGYATDNASLLELAVLLEDAIDVHDRHWKIHWMINFAQFSATKRSSTATVRS